jgi:hypothetical protein
MSLIPSSVYSLLRDATCHDFWRGHCWPRFEGNSLLGQNCQETYPHRHVWITDFAPDGTAIGVVTLGDEQPHPQLADGLPGWCLRVLSLDPRQQKLEPWHVAR